MNQNSAGTLMMVHGERAYLKNMPSVFCSNINLKKLIAKHRQPVNFGTQEQNTFIKKRSNFGCLISPQSGITMMIQSSFSTINLLKWLFLILLIASLFCSVVIMVLIFIEFSLRKFNLSHSIKK